MYIHTHICYTFHGSIILRNGQQDVKEVTKMQNIQWRILLHIQCSIVTQNS
jgi:G:T-mismatch repair DNA endonuclease (very short patch repair protein)